MKVRVNSLATSTAIKLHDLGISILRFNIQDTVLGGMDLVLLHRNRSSRNISPNVRLLTWRCQPTVHKVLDDPNDADVTTGVM